MGKENAGDGYNWILIGHGCRDTIVEHKYRGVDRKVDN